MTAAPRLAERDTRAAVKLKIRQRLSAPAAKAATRRKLGLRYVIDSLFWFISRVTQMVLNRALQSIDREEKCPSSEA